MQRRSSTLSFAALAFALALGGCSNQAYVGVPYLQVELLQRPVSVPAGGTATFTAEVSNAQSIPQFSILNAADTPSAGTLTPQSSPADTVLYTAPATPPIYTVSGFTQGTVTVVVTATAPPGTSYPTATDSVTFYITSPTISVGLSPATASVALGATQQFIGYAVGSVNAALTWEVNGVPGGSTATGTISSPAGLYTAPATLPMSGNAVTITAISQADPTKSASSVITLH